MPPHLLGIVENMSGFVFPRRNKVHDIIGIGKAFARAAERVAGRLSVEAARKPRKPTIMLRTVR